MRRIAQLAFLALLGWLLAACGTSGPIRVYVEPTYEQDKLEQLLAAYPGLKVLWHPGSEDVSLRVEAARLPASVRTLRAVVRARARRTGYEVHAIADLLPHKSREALRARWVNSYSRGSYEDNFPDILHEVVLEAARASHRDFQRTREEVERVATTLPPIASP